MAFLSQLMIAVLVLTWLPLHHSTSHRVAGFHLLSHKDTMQGGTASRLAARSPERAASWLEHLRTISSVRIEPDGRTLDVHFRDGAELVIVPQAWHRLPTSHIRRAVPLTTQLPQAPAAGGRAVVLEPFANELGLGPHAGQAEIDALQGAGYKVDTFLNGDVTIPLMENLASYSVVYMETHAGPLVNADGSVDALVLTGETNAHPYAALFQEGSVLQGFAAGDSMHLYVAIRAKFVTKHIGTFADSSLIYLDGCDILAAPVFVHAVLDRNVSTLVSWDNKVGNTTSEQAAGLTFQDLVAGKSVSASVADTTRAGFGASVYIDPQSGKVITAHLGYQGNGDDTLSRAMAGATPTPSPTSLPTATPTATKVDPKPTKTPVRKKTPKPVHKKPAKKCKKGYKLVKVKGKLTCKKVKKKR